MPVSGPTSGVNAENVAPKQLSLPSDSVESAMVRAIKARDQHNTNGLVVQAEPRNVPTPTDFDDLVASLRQFISGKMLENGGDDPYGLLLERPISDFNRILVDHLLRPTRDHFLELVGLGEAPGETDEDASYQIQIIALQEQVGDLWADIYGENAGNIPALVYIVQLDHEKIVWNGDRIPELTRIDWEVRLLDEQSGR